jgi:hypothetical protein
MPLLQHALELRREILVVRHAGARGVRVTDDEDGDGVGRSRPAGRRRADDRGSRQRRDLEDHFQAEQHDGEDGQRTESDTAGPHGLIL